MTRIFNKSRYIKLLKKNQILESKNKFLSEQNKLEYRELLSYAVVLEDQIV